MGVRNVGILLLLLICSGFCFADASQGQNGQIQLRVYQEYDDATGILIAKNELVGLTVALENDGVGMAVHKNEVGEIVTYNLYLEEQYSGSCEIPYGVGECTITASLPAGFSFEGKKFWHLSGAGVKDFNIAIVPTNETSADRYRMHEYDLFLYLVGSQAFGDFGLKSAIELNLLNVESRVNESFDIDVNIDDNLVEKVRVYSLEQGVTKFRLYPAIETKAPCSIKIVLDPDNRIQETNETNNIMKLIQKHSNWAAGKGSWAVVPAEWRSNQPLDIEYGATNDGDDVNRRLNLLLTLKKIDGNGSVEYERTLQNNSIASLKSGEILTFTQKGLVLEEGYYIIESDLVDLTPKASCGNINASSSAKSILEYIECTMNDFSIPTYLDYDLHVKNNKTEYDVIEIKEPPAQNSTRTYACQDCPDYCDGKTRYHRGSCNPETGKCGYSAEECPNGCDLASAKCIQMLRNVRFDVFIDNYEQGVVASGKDEITVTASLIDEKLKTVEPIEGANVIFEIDAPAGSKAFWQTGHSVVIEGTTDQNGEAKATFAVPQLEEFYLGSQEDTYLKLSVKASKHEGDYDFDYEDGLYTIKVLSPAVSIGNITISPNPAKAYQAHEIKIKISDAYADGPAHFVVKAPEGVLSYGQVRGSEIAFDSYDRELMVDWEAPGTGLTPYEFDFAKEIESVRSEYKIDTGINVVGIVFPIVKSGSTVYGIYDDAGNMIGEIGALSGSLSMEEGAYRVLDAGISGIKIVIGAAGIMTKRVPGIGAVAGDFIKTTTEYGLGIGQAELKQKAAEARMQETETKKMNMMIEVDVLDSDGYYDSDFLVFEEEYLLEKK